MNEYKTIYLKDMLNLIDRVALETVTVPQVTTAAHSSGMWTENNANAAVYNEGIRNMVIELRKALLEEDESDD